jgi:transposase
MAIVTLGSDLAKNVYALHGVNATGKPALVRPSVARSKLLEVVAALPPCLIGMEACSGAHHCARLFQAHGHTVRLMAPKFVTPYRLSGKAGKNDAADAAAICEAVTRPSMRFVPPKSLQQQSELLVHAYLRMLLILGARSVLQSAKDKTDPVSQWAVQLAGRVGYWKAIVAIAAKNACMCWAVLARGEAFRLPPEEAARCSPRDVQALM